MAVLEIADLKKTYRGLRKGTRQALDGLDMVVEAGQVHGFLGPNGSGKTTTLRALLGLVRANGGQMRLFGELVPQALPGVVPRLGAIVESPQFFGNFSGRRTLRLLATAGGVPRKRVDEVLELVGLRDRARQRVKTYSLGMKQRLAVASALLKSPELLILDEPANGLDPAGIREMRDMMRTLAATGTTVVLSSHILDEVQHICDSVTIISRGRRVVAGPVAEVLATQDRREYRLRLADHRGAAPILVAAGHQVAVHDDHLVVSNLSDPAAVTEILAKHRDGVGGGRRVCPGGGDRHLDHLWHPGHPVPAAVPVVDLYRGVAQQEDRTLRPQTHLRAHGLRRGQKFVITWPYAGALLLTGVVVIVLAAFAAMRRRDVS